MSDYLWSKSGPPDPEVEQLEAMLTPLAYTGAPPPLPRPRRVRPWIAAGLAFGAAALLALFFLRAPRPIAREDRASAPRLGWALAPRGPVRVDGTSRAEAALLPVGAWLETDTGTAQLAIPGVGELRLGPQSRARILETRVVENQGGRHRLELARGRLEAQVRSPARQLVIETRYVSAIDLGCAFDLRVDEAGRGLLTVTEGAVALSDRGTREVAVPTGAACPFDEHGPGTPYYTDASPRFREALALPRTDPRRLRELVDQARPKDALSLRQLAGEVDATDRALLESRIRELEGAQGPRPIKDAPRPGKHGDRRRGLEKPKARTAPDSKLAPYSPTGIQ